MPPEAEIPSRDGERPGPPRVRSARLGRPRALVLSTAVLAAATTLARPARADEPKPPTPASAAAARSDEARARGLVDRLRDPEISRRDDAVRELAALAAAEDERAAGGERPIHAVLATALRDADPEVRFRARRILGGPELRVSRTLDLLLKPMPTDDVHAALHELVDKTDKRGLRAGLVRLARRAARSGTGGDDAEWRPYGVCRAASLQDQSRFTIALDLLADLVTDEEDVRATADLLHEELGAGLEDVVEALAARPEISRSVLRELLHDAQPTTRLQAALALGEIGTVADVPSLEALLQDKDPLVRRAAVTAFSILPIDSAACARAAALARDPDPRVAAVAVRLGAARGLRFVLEPAVKLLSVGDAAPANMPDELRDALDQAREEAARAIGRLGAADSAAALVPWTARQGKMASYAAWGLGGAGNIEYADALERMSKRDEFAADPAVYYALARVGAVGLLERIVKTGADEPRRCALAALGAARGDPVALARILEDAGTRALERGAGRAKDWNDFEQAFRALRDRNDPQSRAALARLLDRASLYASREPDRGALRSVVEYAQECNATECLRTIEQFIDVQSRDPFLAQTAIDALSTLDPARARVVLARRLEAGGDRNIAAAYARGLSRAGDRSHSDLALDHSKEDVQRALGDNGGVPGSVRYALNGLGIDEMYAGHAQEYVLCFRRMRWIMPDNNMASYNTACGLSLEGKTDAALRWLRRSMCEGFRDWRHIEGDADLLNVSKDPRFSRLIEEMRLEQEIEPAPSGGE